MRSFSFPAYPVMASTYLILISVLLTASQTQGQCPLGSCSLVSQVNICTNESARASELGCSDIVPCVMALRDSTTVEECCNKIVESIPSAPTIEQSGRICGEGGVQREFGNSLGLVNTVLPLDREVHEGTYVVPQRNPDFTYYICSGCVRYIQLAVSPISVYLLKDAQGRERIKFHTFTRMTGDRSIYQRREDAVMWTSSVIANTRTDRRIVNYRPVGSTRLCFSQDDVFGFTIEAGSGITVLTRFFPEGNRFIHNVSSTLETISVCPRFSDIGLYTITENFALTPLIHIVTGGFPPTEPPLTTTEAFTTEPISQTTDRRVSSSSSRHVINGVGGFVGAVGIVLIAGVIVMVVLVSWRMKHKRNTQYRKPVKPNNSISLGSNEAYGVSNLYEDGDRLKNNVAYAGVSSTTDYVLVDGIETYGVSQVGVIMDKNKAYEATLRQTVSDKALQELVDNTTPTYDYPQMDLNNLETEPNEAYATVATQ